MEVEVPHRRRRVRRRGRRRPAGCRWPRKTPAWRHLALVPDPRL